MPVFGLMMICMPQVHSQNISWDSALESILPIEDLSSQDYEELLSMYESLHDSPLNINTALPNELLALQFLTDSQVEDIQAYVYIHGPMLTLGELQLIGSLDYNTRQLLLYFVYAGAVPEKKERISLAHVLKDGRSTVVAGMEIPLYMRDGFKSHSQEELIRYPNRKYLGSRLSHSIRYSFDWHGRIRFGLTAQQDGGEPFFQRNRMGYDYISPYFFARDIGIFHELAIGNFRASFGYGLLMNGGFTAGKTMVLSSMERTPAGLKPHSSTQEYGYLRGVGSSFRKKHSTLTVLGSYSPQDATLKADSAISSFKQDGYHRTELEWSKKHNIAVYTAAADIRYDYRGLGFGATVLGDWLSLPYNGRTSNLGISSDWSLRRTMFSTGGQVALNNGHFAAILTQHFRLPCNLGLNMVFRHYSPDYYAMRASALSEGGVSNETGLLTALSYNSGRIKAGAYVDLFRHPEPRYGASAPSNGMDVRMETEWNKGKRNELFCMARLKSKQKDCKYTGQLEYLITFGGRVRWTYSFAPGSQLRMQLLVSRYDFIAEPVQNGWACTLEYNKSLFNEQIQASLSAAWFNTDSYDCNISVYEKGLRYSYGFITLYGTGARLNMLLKFKLNNRSGIGLKLGSTIFTDRDQISSSQQRIDSNHKEDLSIQLTHNF